MTSGQATVLLLLILLALLEAATNQGIRDWFKNAYGSLGKGLSS